MFWHQMKSKKIAMIKETMAGILVASLVAGSKQDEHIQKTCKNQFPTNIAVHSAVAHQKDGLEKDTKYGNEKIRFPVEKCQKKQEQKVNASFFGDVVPL